MSAAEDDTELRDLLIQNLENSGVLNKLKAEMRAAVFLAMEDQDRLENKTPLINENLKKCLNTKDGHLVASLIMDFLQVFNLDFSLAVFQPEINLLNGLDSRDLVCRELGVSDSELNQNAPVLLELVRRARRSSDLPIRSEGDRSGHVVKDLSQKQISHARKTFDSHDKDQSGSVRKEDLKLVFTDLLPSLNKSMLERFVDEELRAADSKVDFQSFLSTYKSLFDQCRSVVVSDSDESRHQTQTAEDKPGSLPVSKIPRFKGQRSQTAAKDLEQVLSLPKRYQQEQPTAGSAAHLDLELDGDVDHDEGDSFFDDPLPKPLKTYGCSPIGEKESSERTNSPKDVVPLREEGLCGPPVSLMRRGRSLSDLSVLAADPEPERGDPVSDLGSELRKPEASGTRGSPAGSLSEASRPGAGSIGSEPSHSRNGLNDFKDKYFKSPRTGSLHLDEDVEYDDDFNSHRSDLSNGELSIGEEIEEVSIEGPETSDKLDETTQDLSVSQVSQSHGVDYMEDVS
ncbi:centrosomal protein 43 isoform X1 [Poecilia formosa]|uniref:centrosomal protein 43 isoform X1 n=1 Tax=Poecilia formosa TaxID=48698 RepID=UPI0007B855C1|nr:PREDICTED: FGFR1 oncogene partner isoform X1 [Poecilia formosa]